MVPDKYEQHRPDFLKLLEEFEDIWDGHHRRTNTRKHRIELTDNDIRLVHNAPYRASPKARKFAATENDRVQQENVIEPAATE